MKKITAFATKEDGKPLEIHNKPSFLNSLSVLLKGKYKITVEKYYTKSTPSQFGWLYACVYPHSLIALNAEGYEFTTIDEVDEFWKTLYANKPNLNRETGQIVDVPMSKAQFLTVDQMTYCESIRHYCLEYLGYSIPDPDKDYKKKHPEFI